MRLKSFTGMGTKGYRRQKNRKLSPLFPGQSKDYIRLFWTFGVIVFVAAMMVHPRLVFDGALMGLKTWWNIVFPALMPFFIASELLISFGIVHFMGVLLEPVMRPLFNVPGSGSFVMCIGFTSGCPIGSMITARLRSERLCTRVEAERLMSFTNNSSPLFMLVAVAVGMFNNPTLGVLIAGAHYLSNLTLGVALRFYGRGDPERAPEPPVQRSGLLRLAIRQMLQVQRQENRPLGKIMGDAVQNAITNLLNIGGFIILFAVIIKLLTAAGFIEALAGLLGILLLPLGFAPELLSALSSGFFEMTIGSKLASESSAPLIQQVVAVGMILAWSGLSVHAQAASMIAATDLRMTPFILSRMVHTCLAGIYTCFILKWAGPEKVFAAPVTTSAINWHNLSFITLSLQFLAIFMASLGVMILFGLLLHLFHCTVIFIHKNK